MKIIIIIKISQKTKRIPPARNNLQPQRRLKTTTITTPHLQQALPATHIQTLRLLLRRKKKRKKKKKNIPDEDEEMPSSFSIYLEDIVATKKNPKQPGVVATLGWKKEEEEEDEEEQDDELAPDEVRVVWGPNDASVEKASQLVVLDRSMMIGNVVAKKSERDNISQTGLITQMDLRFTVKTVGKTVIENVNAKWLKPILPFDVSTLVIMDDWLGFIDQISVDIVVAFEDGCIVAIEDADTDIVWPFGDPDADYDYYPGLIVQAKPRTWKEGHYLNGSYKLTHIRGMVSNVMVTKLFPRWIANRNFEEPTEAFPPAVLHKEKFSSLKTLNAFDSEMLEVSTQVMLPSELSVLSVEEFEKFWLHQQDPNKNQCPSEILKKIEDHRPQLLNPFKNSGVIIGSSTVVNVQWQDNTESHGLKSIELVPVEDIIQGDFWPNDFVSSRNDNSKFGYVIKTNSVERTCVVQWLEKGEKVSQPQIVPVFDLIDHSLYNYERTDIVCHYPDESKKDRPWVGEILNLKDGKVTVQWYDKSVSCVTPDEVWKVDPEDYEEEEEYEEYDEEEEEEEEEEEGGENDLLPTEDNESSWWSVGSNILSKFREVSFPSIFSTSATDPLMGRELEEGEDEEGEDEEDEEDEEGEDAEDEEEEEEDQNETPDKKPRKAASVPFSPEKSPIDSPDMSQVLATLPKEPPSLVYGKFACFEAQPTFEKHSFDKRVWENVHPHFHKRIILEWQILAKCLPEGVIVRASEDKIYLMKVMIIGPKGTPYHNIVFWFDVFIPPDYPVVPPEIVHSYAGREQMNPNLLKSGGVCLSLLGTWSGKGTENWSPRNSNLLQVFVSIQGLILGTPEPYYLEAGHDKLKGTFQGKRASKQYNERAVLMALETIPISLHSAPDEFKEIIQFHFSKVGPQLVSLCNSYLQMKNQSSKSEVETNNRNNNNNNNNHNNDSDNEIFTLPSPSLGFLESLKGIFTKIEEDLKQNQANFK